MQEKRGYVYLMANKTNTTIYTGVTSDLVKRVYEHKEKLADGFTKKYNITKLVYYEMFESIEDAIIREKKIKGGSRAKKLALITESNPDYKDLYESIV
ncbi:MAG TPA: GIY-YIG nuclease family protein [Candidatus Omnitrophota bacterium]|nr:GIY-YIG nuclease family protein [Candidatus Omnitrophota bacterium]